MPFKPSCSRQGVRGRAPSTSAHPTKLRICTALSLMLRLRWGPLDQQSHTAQRKGKTGNITWHSDNQFRQQMQDGTEGASHTPAAPAPSQAPPPQDALQGSGLPHHCRACTSASSCSLMLRGALRFFFTLGSPVAVRPSPLA